MDGGFVCVYVTEMQEMTSCCPHCFWCETDGPEFLNESRIRASPRSLLEPQQSSFYLVIRINNKLRAWHERSLATSHLPITVNWACVCMLLSAAHMRPYNVKTDLAWDQCINCVSPIICMPFSLFIGLFPPQRSRKVRATCIQQT